LQLLQDVLAKNCDALAAPPGGELLALHLSGGGASVSIMSSIKQPKTSISFP